MSIFTSTSVPAYPGVTPTKQDHTTRQAPADVELSRVNSAFVNTKDIDVPPFIHACITTRGAIIFTTSNCQSNVIYEDYITIIADALSYLGKCEVEVGKRFSQFLLHGVPTQYSLPEISDSIAVNYHQLVQVQTPRWLTAADRRQNKTHSTIIMTLAGNIKKTDVGLHNLIICNRECQLEEYIAYSRSTQCRNCQRYGHPAALCREALRCAVCAGPHATTSGKKFCVRMQGHRPGAADAQDAQNANWQGIRRPDDACQRTGRSERHTPRHLHSGREVTGHLTSGREVSGHLPSGRSAFLTDGDCQGKFLPDAECQGKCRRDDACHGICLLDVECQGICHPDAVRSFQAEIVKANFFRTQRVKANVVRTTRATASAFGTRSVRAFAIRTQRVPYRRRVSRQM